MKEEIQVRTIQLPNDHSELMYVIVPIWAIILIFILWKIGMG